MEDDIDFRRYAWALLRGWKLILGLGFVAALVAAGVSLSRPRDYEATALVSVAELPYSLQLQGINPGEALPARSYQDLALSDEVLSQVLDEVQRLFPGEAWSLSQLREKLAAGSASDPSLVQLTVSSRHPAQAAELANAWAAALVARAAQLYGPGTSQLQSYVTQLGDAEAALAQAEQELVAFQAHNQTAILTAQLTSVQRSMSDYLDREHRLTVLRRDAQDLLARLEAQAAQALASPVDEAALLLLVAQASGSQPAQLAPNDEAGVVPAPVASPLQVQINLSSASGQTAGQLTATTRAFVESLAAQAAEAQGQAAALFPQVLDLQTRLAEAEVAGREVQRARDLAEKLYLVLAAQVNEASIAAQEAGSTIKIASRAAVPEEPAGFGPGLITVAGLAAGLMAGSALALMRAWLQPPAGPQPKAAPAAERGPSSPELG